MLYGIEQGSKYPNARRIYPKPNMEALDTLYLSISGPIGYLSRVNTLKAERCLGLGHAL